MDEAQGLGSRYFDLHSVMYITELEIGTLFRVFFREFHVPCDEYLGETDWLIENIKNIMFSKRMNSHKLMKLYVEIKRNPILRNPFRTTTPSSLSKMMGELFWILATAEKENELRAVEYHRNVVISELEYDEFVNLYFQIYCPDVNDRVTVGPKLFSIKEIMVGEKLRRVEVFASRRARDWTNRVKCVHKWLIWFSISIPTISRKLRSLIYISTLKCRISMISSTCF